MEGSLALADTEPSETGKFLFLTRPLKYSIKLLASQASRIFLVRGGKRGRGKGYFPQKYGWLAGLSNCGVATIHLRDESGRRGGYARPRACACTGTRGTCVKVARGDIQDTCILLCQLSFPSLHFSVSSAAYPLPLSIIISYMSVPLTQTSQTIVVMKVSSEFICQNDNLRFQNCSYYGLLNH